MNILITGGAGYIGSHVAKFLLCEARHQITILDNLSTGFASTIDTLRQINPKLKFVNANLSNWHEIEQILSHRGFDLVIHFAASLIVSESVENPLKYYLNNTANTANLISLCVKYGINRFIFSSTAAVYGEPHSRFIPASEQCPASPINPYGHSKLFSEQILTDTAKANSDFGYVILRYFNVAGADNDGILGQNTKDATHLIKIATQCATGKRDKMYILGDSYDTADGTCIRDYIHVDDLAMAHVCAMEFLNFGKNEIFNCGYGNGYSVKEVIEAVKRVSKVDFDVKIGPKRAGDPAVLVAENSKILSLIDWKPKYNDIDLICKTSLDWEKKLP